MITITKLNNNYTTPVILKGSWQLAGGHGAVDREKAIDDMFAFYDAGMTTFDCADIYAGVEELIGDFIHRLRRQRGQAAADKVQVHTKYVPDRESLRNLTSKQVEETIHRSIKRLGIQRLDLVQFHWWDYTEERYVQTATTLRKLQEQGYIKHIGLTNFDTKRTQEFYDAGVRSLTNQVQYSVLDRRPEKTMTQFCKATGMKLVCYGTIAGGLLSDKYLGSKVPDINNRSHTKYGLIISDIGKWDAFQGILNQLKQIGTIYDASISEIAMAYVLHKPHVAAIVVGARDSSHIDSLRKVSHLKIRPEHLTRIDDLVKITALKGDVYELERNTDRHAKIMKYNLNKESS
ncbi:MAG TPA: aldo/keto reductase [Candidatus Saccharimonadales bacterium]